jgi:hydroxymethylglutaryl-CoA lyase
MAFGNPLGDDWSIEEAVNAVDLLVESGVTQITLDDTAGLATPKLISDLFSDVSVVHDEIDMGLHLRAQPQDAAIRIRAAYQAGCRRFNTVMGGFDSTAALGNTLAPTVPTEIALSELRNLGAELDDMRPVESLVHAASEIARKYGARVQ